MPQSTLVDPLSIYVSDPTTLTEPLPARYFVNNPRQLPGDKRGPKFIVDDSNRPLQFSIVGTVHEGNKHSVTPYGTFTGRGDYVSAHAIALCTLADISQRARVSRSKDYSKHILLLKSNSSPATEPLALIQPPGLRSIVGIGSLSNSRRLIPSRPTRWMVKVRQFVFYLFHRF
jgi:hypothetical protein